MTLPAPARRVTGLPVLVLMCLGQPGLACGLHCLVFHHMSSAMTVAVASGTHGAHGERGPYGTVPSAVRGRATVDGGAGSFCHPSDPSRSPSTARLPHLDPMVVAGSAGVARVTRIFLDPSWATLGPPQHAPPGPRGPPPRA